KVKSSEENAAAAEERAHEAIESAKRKRREHMMGVTVEHNNDLYTLLVDSVGDVISLSKKSYEGNPSTLDPLWREFASGVYRLDKNLMVVLDVGRLLDLKGNNAA
ncbi:MAG TPA: chemotaxis protein CheW, partial [Magnetovibrio sp.]